MSTARRQITLNIARHPQSHVPLIMNITRFIFGAMLAGGLSLLAGCVTTPGTDTAQDSTKYTIENTEKFVALDEATQAAIVCTGLQERVRPDGRLEIVANVKNRDKAPLAVQINCVFKDAQGFSIGDETQRQKIELPGDSTETVRFLAANAQAKRYTIRIRQAR